MAPNKYLISRVKISSATVGEDDHTSATELDSHANMVVAGKDFLVIQDTGLTANVNPFSDELQSMNKVPIVDGVTAYDCPYTHETILCVVRNALHVPTVDHNLVSPFIMREAG